MFARSIQPDVVSLFSSTGSDPLGLFSIHVDDSLPVDSFVHLLHDATSLPAPRPPAALIANPSTYRNQHTATSQGHELDQTVLHIQSPTLRNTFIQCPPSGPVLKLTPGVGLALNADGGHDGRGGSALGLTHPWLHIQVRNLGRDWSFDVCIVDKMGRRGTVRCSTFQTSPKLVRHPGASPLLHLPLAFPPPSTNPLTAWSTITLDLSKFGSHFASLALVSSLNDALVDNDKADAHHAAAERGESSTSSSNQAPLPSGTYSHLAFIKVYATCRLRRIWLSQSSLSSSSAPITRTPWEFELYGD